MLFKTIHAERMKLKHSPVWLAFFILPVIPAVMGTFNYLQCLDILKSGWYSLWTQHTLFECYFFLPAIIGVYCSYLCRLEHLNHNWNTVMTVPVPVSCIYFAKLLSASFMVILTQIWIGILFFISGKLCGITGPVPSKLAVWLIYGMIGGIVICALQICISLVIRSFAVPVGIALMGGIAGMAAMVKGYGAYFPYSLISVGMCANNPRGVMQCTMSQFVLSSIIYVAVFCIFTVLYLKKRDVIVG